VAVTSDPGALTERDKAILDFEASWFVIDGDRIDILRERFACSPEEYTLELNRVIDHPGAIEFSPLVVRRLQRNRQRRRRARLVGSVDVSNQRGGRA
jgi:Protein of unknown function (DUF3263)